MDYEAISKVISTMISDHGLATVLVIAAMFGIHKWATKIFDWYTNTRWPQERTDKNEKLKADQEYRLAHTVKLDTLSDVVRENSVVTEQNTAATKRIGDVLLTKGIHITQEH